MQISRTQMMSEHQLILEASGVGVWRYEITENQFHCDSVCRFLLGIESEEEYFPLEKIFEHVHSDDHAQLKNVLSGEGLGLETLSFEFRSNTNPEDPKYLLSRARHLPDLGGTPGKLMGVLIDNTENKRLQQSLNNSEARFEKLAWSLPDIFLYLDKDMQIEFANAEFCNQIGLELKDVEGKQFEEVLGSSRTEVHRENYLRALAGEHVIREMPGRNFQGKARYLRYTYAPVTAESGQVAGIILVGTDISQRRALEQRVIQSEAKLRMLVDGFPSLFFYLNKNLEFEIANDAFLNASQIPMEDLIGKSCEEILGNVYPARLPYLQRALAGESVSFEDYGTDISLNTHDQYFRYNYKPALNNGGDVIGILCEATNMTERRKLELELRRSNKDLEQFAYVASHDLKAPLRAIEVIVSWLREDLSDHDEGDVKENLSLLTQRTKRLGRLLDDLLAYSRAGRKVGKITEVNTKELVLDIVQMISPPEEMTVSIPDSMPIISTYSAPLEQVLRNLISNAIKHHPGPTGNVTVTAEETQDHFVFSVADDGSGIPGEYSDRIFRMFQTLKPRDEIEGSGMGLAIVSRIVEWQGGRVWFEPVHDGSGTTFMFQWSKTAPQVNTEERAA